MCVCVCVCVDARYRLTLEVEVLCNWFKVDAISPVPLKGGLKKISLEGRQRERERKGMDKKRRKKGRKKDFICLCPEGCVVSHNDRTRSIVRSTAY